MKTELTDEQLLYKITVAVYGEGILKESARPKKLTLDLMHEAENLLTDDQHKVFRQRLWALTNLESPKWGDDDWNRAYASATATQRARAFLMTMEGKV